MDVEPTYTVFIRLPFPRGDFVDPPPVNWDSSKDEELWKILSGVTKTDIEWNELAARFQVTVDFLLQQATYLTEHHASQVRAQMRKATASKGSAAPSPIPGTDSSAGPAEAMRRTGSGGGRAPSSLSIRRDSPLLKNDASIPGTPNKSAARPQVSRASSANTTVQVSGGSSLKLGKPLLRPVSPQSQRRRLSSLPISTTVTEPGAEDDPLSPGPAESSSAPSSSSSSPAQSRIIRRPPRFHQHQDGASSPNDGDDDSEPAFLPFKAQPGFAGSGQYQDPSATLRGDPRDLAKRHPNKAQGKDRAHQSQTSDSSAGSAAVGSTRPPGPLSPRRTAELSGRSPGGKGKYSREGSEGTPSMGSSFSDLDDASVTQSALEEALASKMQDGGTIGSRMSTISQAFRSRYLPKP